MKRFTVKKLNNEGAALILAMVIVLFITVLTSLLLYITGVNYEMKTTDYRTKVSFYGSETPLEELRVQLAVDASQAAEKAYKHVITNFSVFNTASQRESEFQEKFFEEFEKIWEDRGVNDVLDADEWKTAISSILTNTDYDIHKSDESQDSSKPYHIEIKVNDPGTGVLGTTLTRQVANGRIVLYEIKVSYTEDEFVSIISTNYAIEVPEIDWSVDRNDNTVPGITSDDTVRTEIFFENCVSYLDWEKQ